MENEYPISKMYAFNALNVRKAHHQKYEEGAPKPTYTMVSPSALIGIEIELENITAFVPLGNYWTSKDDGSLRNCGVEFVSSPLRGYQIPYALPYLKELITRYNTPDFSTRTSVHIHLNVRDMPPDQIRTLILLYALFERHFFNIAGTKRETSVFCVPLYRTQQLQGMLNWDMPELSLNWHKYGAINCGTVMGNNDVPKFGTIEFRHMYGTLDEKLLVDWINQIMLLREASHQIKLEELLELIKTMNTTSAYAALYKKVFKEYTLMGEMTKRDFEYCVTTTKLALFGWDYAKQCPHIKADSAYWKKVEAKRKKVNMSIFNTLKMEVEDKPQEVPPPLNYDQIFQELMDKPIYMTKGVFVLGEN